MISFNRIIFVPLFASLLFLPAPAIAIGPYRIASGQHLQLLLNVGVSRQPGDSGWSTPVLAFSVRQGSNNQLEGWSASLSDESGVLWQGSILTSRTSNILFAFDTSKVDPFGGFSVKQAGIEALFFHRLDGVLEIHPQFSGSEGYAEIQWADIYFGASAGRNWREHQIAGGAVLLDSRIDPILTIQIVPEPSTCHFLASALPIAVYILSRRRQQPQLCHAG